MFRNSGGFSLIEMAVLLVIFGGLAAASTMLGSKWVEGTEFQTSRQNIETIEKAIDAYVRLNRRLPCPADMTVSSTSSNFGKEDTTADCGGLGAAEHGPFNTDAMKGVVPFQTLGVGKSLAYDAWGNRLSYYVDRRMTREGALDLFPVNNTTVGSVIVQDLTGANRTSKAVFALVSHGARAHGAYSRSGALMTADNPHAGELENADVNAAGASTGPDATLVQALASGSFDDIVSYKNRSQLATSGVNGGPKSCAADAAVTWAACAGSRGELADGESVQVVDSTGPDTGTVIVVCDNGTANELSPSCSTTGAPCVAQAVSWTVGANTCNATVGALTDSQFQDVSDSTPSPSGAARFTCNNGTLNVSNTSCNAQCAAATVNWTQSGNNCTGSVGVVAHGANTLVSDALNLPADQVSGNVTVTCANGVLSQSGVSCTYTNNSCTGGAQSWSVDNGNGVRNCSGSINPTLADGANETATDSTVGTPPNGSGTANYSCADGTLTEGAKTCRADCVAATANWTVGSSNCTFAHGGMTDAASQLVSDASGPDTGDVTLSCSDGVISQSSPTCTTAASCSVGSAESVRFRSNDREFYKTIATAPTSQRTQTVSFWMKPSSLPSLWAGMYYLGSSAGNGSMLAVAYESDGSLRVSYDGSGAGIRTSARYRDFSTWMHVVAVIDTTQTASSERLKIFVDGERVTSFVSATYPAQNLNINNTAGYIECISPSQLSVGCALASAFPYNGYLDKYHRVDGQALEPTAFGEYDSDGIWVPKGYSGTYGNNGFLLEFGNATSVATLGNDSSGNSKHFTANNFSVAADATRDSVSDNPGTNYATWNPIDANLVTASNGNLTASTPATSNQIRATIGMSTGKWYWEVTPASATGAGVCPGIVSEKSPNTVWLGFNTYGWCYNGNTGQIFYNNANSAFSVGFTQNDVIGIAFDANTGKLWFAKNGTWGASGNPAAGTNPARTVPTGETYFPALGDTSNGTATTSNVNFGQQPFVYSAPSGFEALTVANLPAPAIVDPSEHFDAITYRGNGGGQQIGKVARDASAYQLDRSLRFRAANGNYLTRTFTAGERRKFTLSFWAKRGSLGTTQVLFSARYYPVINPDLNSWIGFNANDQMEIDMRLDNTSEGRRVTTRQFKDTSRWYHFTIKHDTTNVLPVNRLQIFVDGWHEQSLAVQVDPAFDRVSEWNEAGRLMRIGALHYSDGSVPHASFDGYLADIYYLDGIELNPYSFGDFDSKGHFQPKAYTGAYGPNGFHLDFVDNSSVAQLGNDVSGNNNDFTPTGFSVASGYTNDSLTDVPTSWDDTGGGGTVVLAPTSDTTNNSGVTVAGDGLTMTGSGGAGDFAVRAVTAITGKKYFEYTVGASVANTAGVVAGIVLDSYNLYDTNQHNGQPQVWGINMNGFRSHTAYEASMAAYAAGDVVMIAVDKTAGKIWFGKNGVWPGHAWMGADPAAGTNPHYADIGAGQVVMPYFYEGNFAVTASGKFNFGATAFAYSPPAGFSGMQSPIGNGRGNYPTVEPIDKRGFGYTVSNGNLDFAIGRDVYAFANTAVPKTGKWYWEIDLRAAGADAMCGVSQTKAGVGGGASGVYTTAGAPYVYPIDDTWYGPMAGPQMANGTCMVAVDMDNDRFFTGNNGVWYFGGDPATGANPLNRVGAKGWTLKDKKFYPAIGNLSPIGSPSTTQGSFNFGQRPFSYVPPTGFKAINSQNAGTADKFVNAPDLVWLKSRISATDHALYDRVRGIKKDLGSNLSTAETTQEGGVVQFNDDGVLIGDLTKLSGTTTSNGASHQNNVGWMWNEDATAGFDIVTYTGNFTAGLTVNHGLGKKPKFMIVKRLDAPNDEWTVYHEGVHDTLPSHFYLYLNSTNPVQNNNVFWNNTEPTATNFTLGTDSRVNHTGIRYVAYLWAEIPGFSKFGRYTGNGSADGPFVYTGFKPRWLLIKRTDTAGFNWYLYDTETNSANPLSSYLVPNSNVAEQGATPREDSLSNGFKIRSVNGAWNTSGGTYIYAAFAELPFTAAGSSAPTSCGCALPWGGSLASGGSVNAYSVPSVTCGNSCPAPEVRTCTNGVLSGSATNQSCSVAACSNCPAGTANWTVGADSCTASVGALNHTNNTTVTDAVAPKIGSATVTCNDGAYNYSATSCSAAASCSAQAVSWTQFQTCNGSVGALAHGASQVATDSSMPGTGTATYTCNNGTLTPSSAVCGANCAVPGSWVGQGGSEGTSTCTQSSWGFAIHGAGGSAMSTNGNFGYITGNCNNGTWNTSWRTCLASCPGGTYNWGGGCTQTYATLQGNNSSTSVMDVTAPNQGAAGIRCTNGVLSQLWANCNP